MISSEKGSQSPFATATWEEKQKDFLDILNCLHSSIKFTSNYSREQIDVSHVEIIQEGYRLLTVKFVKSNDVYH